MSKLDHLIQRELCEILQREVKDPRLTSLITITKVSTSSDLSYAKVFVSIMGLAEEKKKALTGLSCAAGFFRKKLAGRLTLKRVPQLGFFPDDSIEKGAHLLELIDNLGITDQKHQSQNFGQG